MSPTFLAAIFDLDGVITDTALVHAQAWKALVDPLLARPFDLDADYKTFVAGRPRADGIRDFLVSRGMSLPESEIQRISAEKNKLYLDMLEKSNIRTNSDMLARIAVYAAAGVKIGIASGSKNAKRVLELAHLVLPGIIVDGNDVEALGLRPKPAPDIFIHTAQQLGVDFKDCIVFEDSRAALAQLSPARGVLVEMS